MWFTLRIYKATKKAFVVAYGKDFSAQISEFESFSLVIVSNLMGGTTSSIAIWRKTSRGLLWCREILYRIVKIEFKQDRPSSLKYNA